MRSVPCRGVHHPVWAEREDVKVRNGHTFYPEAFKDCEEGSEKYVEGKENLLSGIYVLLSASSA